VTFKPVFKNVLDLNRYRRQRSGDHSEVKLLAAWWYEGALLKSKALVNCQDCKRDLKGKRFLQARFEATDTHGGLIGFLTFPFCYKCAKHPAFKGALLENRLANWREEHER